MRKICFVALVFLVTACKSALKRYGFSGTYIRVDTGKVSVAYDTLVIRERVPGIGYYAIDRKIHTHYFDGDMTDRYQVKQHVGALNHETGRLEIEETSRELLLDHRTGNIRSGRNEYKRVRLTGKTGAFTQRKRI